MGDAVQLLETLAQAAVAAYPALSLSIAYINASDVSTLHYAGDLVEAPNDDTLYEIGSITKTFTGALLAAAVTRSDIELLTPVKEIIPELANSEFPDEITLLSLATHTSGLPALPTNLLDFDVELVLTSPESIPVDNILQPYARYTDDDLIEFLSNYTTPPPPMNSGPEAVEYSNLGAGLLGYALETVLGASYDQLLQEIITGPLALDMPDTTCFLSEEQQQRLVTGVAAKSDASPELIAHINPKELGAFYESPAWVWGTGNVTDVESSDFKNPLRGAGCLKSSITDMAKYAQACINGDALIESSLPDCVSDAFNFPPESPSVCLASSSTILDILGYAQQRQQAAGELAAYPLNAQVLATLEFVASQDDGGFSQAPGPAAADAFDYEYDYDYAAAPGPVQRLRNELIGYGLHWILFDQTDTPVGGDVKYHNGGTFASNSVMVLHPELNVGMVLLSNFPGDQFFYPEDISLEIEDFWRCGAAGDDCE